MLNRSISLMVLTILVDGLIVNAGIGQENNNGRTALPDEIVKAWRDAGVDVGGMRYQREAHNQ